MTNNQGIVYPAVQSGTATGVGVNATDAGMAGPVQPTTVIVIGR